MLVGSGMALAASGWSTPSSVDGTNLISSVSCPSPSFCIAVDGQGNALSFNGNSWSAPTAIDSYALNAVSCPSVSFCVAVDGQGNALTFNGSSWSAADSIDTNGLESESCTSTSFCAAVDSSGYALTFNGSSWNSAGDIANQNPLPSVSCQSSSFCVAVDNQGNALTYDGSSWSGPEPIDTASLSSVACPSVSMCIAVDTQGNELSFNGSSWSAPARIDSAGAPVSVSCPSTSFCAAVDNGGYALTYDNGLWSPPASIDAATPLSAVSCASASFCAAADGSGNALIYSPLNQHTLTVVIQGSGTVSGSGISCPGTCSQSYPAGTAVALDAMPATGSAFDGWSGACAGSGGCNLTISGNEAVTASFAPATTPVISDFQISPPRFEAGGPAQVVATYNLSEPVSVHFVLQLKVAGRRVNGSCVPANLTNANRPACSRYVSFGGPGLTVPAPPGPNTLFLTAGMFNTLSGGTAAGASHLKPGSYRVQVTPVGGKTAQADFTVTPPKKVLIVIQPVTVSGSARDVVHFVTRDNPCTGDGTMTFTWSTQGLPGGRAPGVFSPRIGVLLLGAHGFLPGTFSFDENVTCPPGASVDDPHPRCGPVPARYALFLWFVTLPNPRLGGPGLSSCVGKALPADYVSSDGHISPPDKVKLHCKKGTSPTFRDCTVEPGTKVTFSGSGSMTLCQRRPIGYIRCLELPGGGPLGTGSEFSSWEDQQTWRLQVKFSTPKCYEVVPGKPRKKVSCPHA
ncbi:hypothetical protein [Conexibacter sp. DBS9H8]|uniref:InlB B-repeat-containing protein n=1 Tax=Conexibacter sp. DBS9H8 TaxID=2937801 RepID=UPI00200D3411|nr:hypothetical protein [Conexibacter sp. DBS9H8]